MVIACTKLVRDRKMHINTTDLREFGVVPIRKLYLKDVRLELLKAVLALILFTIISSI
jgi:hypothetical protein